MGNTERKPEVKEPAVELPSWRRTRQFFMAVGIFPAQYLSSLKKPWMRSFMSGVGSVASAMRLKRIGDRATFIAKNYLRSSQEVWDQDIRTQEGLRCTKPLVTVKRGEKTLELETFQIEAIPSDALAKTEKEKAQDPEQYYYIHIPGNSGECSRFFPDIADLCKIFPKLIGITYNHVGVGNVSGRVVPKPDAKSTGNAGREYTDNFNDLPLPKPDKKSTGKPDREYTDSYHHLVAGAKAQYARLRDLGVDPSRIIFSGFSIGGATNEISVAEINASLKAEGKSALNTIGDRTFDTMENVVVENFPARRMFRALGAMDWVRRQVRPLLKRIGWDMDTKAAYGTIDPANKALLYVKPKTDKVIPKKIIGAADIRIPASVSLAQSQTEERKASIKTALKNLMAEANRTVPAINELKRCAVEAQTHAENAIIHNAISRIIEKLDAIPTDPLRAQDVMTTKDRDEIRELADLALVGEKSKRLAGTSAELAGPKHGDAHAVDRGEIEARTPTAEKLAQETGRSSKADIVTTAFHAAHIDIAQDTIRDCLLTKEGKMKATGYCALFVSSIMEKNKRAKVAEAKVERGPSTPERSLDMKRK